MSLSRMPVLCTAVINAFTPLSYFLNVWKLCLKSIIFELRTQFKLATSTQKFYFKTF